MFASASDLFHLRVAPHKAAGLFRADVEFAGTLPGIRGEVHRTSGIGYAEEEAVVVAVGEVLERYAAGQVPEKHLLSGTAEELGECAVDPQRFPLFSDQQYATRDFPFERFTAKTRLRWAPADRLSDGNRVYVPAQLVHLLADRTFDDTPIGYATSSGMACRPTRDEAILAGLLELIERDAVMLAWYNCLSLPRVQLESVTRHLDEVAKLLQADDAQYALVNLSRFAGVPVALCVRSAPGSFPGITTGAASAATMALAARKAIGEAFQTHTFVTDASDAARMQAGCEITTFAEHAFYHAYPPRPGIADFLLSSSECVRAQDVAPLASTTRQAIDEVVARLAAIGCEVYVVDTTPADPLYADLCTVTVVSPQLCRLDVGQSMRYLGNARLFNAPYELGLAQAPSSPATLNPEPHPLG